MFCKPALSTSSLALGFICAVTCGHSAFGDQMRTTRDSSVLTHFPQARGLTARKDLQGQLSAERSLSTEDLALLLGLSNYAIDKRYDIHARENVVRMLGTFGHQYAIPALAAILRDENDDPGLRLQAARALTRIRDSKVVTILIEDALGSGNQWFEVEILSELSQFVGGPPQLRDQSFRGGFRFPPKDKQGREEYLKVWRDWWEDARDEAVMNRAFRTSH